MARPLRSFLPIVSLICMSKILIPSLLFCAAAVIPAGLRAAEPQPVGAPRLLITDRDTGLPVSGAVVRRGSQLWRSDAAGLLVLNEKALHGDSLTVSAVGGCRRLLSCAGLRGAGRMGRGNLGFPCR